MSSALAQHVRDTAVKHLTEQGKEITPEAIEEQGKWILALWHAQNACEFTIKDLAELFLGGVQPIESIDKECEDLTNVDEDDFGQDVIDFINTL